MKKLLALLLVGLVLSTGVGGIATAASGIGLSPGMEYPHEVYQYQSEESYVVVSVPNTNQSRTVELSVQGNISDHLTFDKKVVTFEKGGDSAQEVPVTLNPKNEEVGTLIEGNITASTESEDGNGSSVDPSANAEIAMLVVSPSIGIGSYYFYLPVIGAVGPIKIGAGVIAALGIGFAYYRHNDGDEEDISYIE